MEEVAAASGVSLRTLYRLFKSRQELLKALRRRSRPSARQRILEAALDLIGRESLARMSMDDLAMAASVSRATLYRLFPGKPALFKTLIQTYSPWEPVAEVLADNKDGLPEQVIPKIADALAQALGGRTGVLLRMVFEMVKGDPDTVEGVRHSMSRGLPDVIQYLGAQMSAGRLRRMHPVVAFQLLAGPIFVHLATLPLATTIGFRAPTKKVVGLVVSAWLRAMRAGS